MRIAKQTINKIDLSFKVNENSNLPFVPPLSDAFVSQFPLIAQLHQAFVVRFSSAVSVDQVNHHCYFEMTLKSSVSLKMMEI